MTGYFGKRRLKPLASTAGRTVVGSHNGKRALVHVDALDDRVVYHHEASHETLFTTTIDGAILGVLWMALDKPTTINDVTTSNLKKTARALFRSSKFAQEVVATYCGIKLVDVAAGEAAIAKLPDEYRRYYRAATRVIDPIFKSTYLQVRVMRAIGAFTFRSRFSDQFFTEPTRAWQLGQQDKADWRLETLLNQLKKLSRGDVHPLRLAVDNWAASFFAKESVDPWDLDSEEGWTVNQSAALKLDISLDACIDRWLVENSTLPSLSKIEHDAAFDRLMVFAKTLGIELQTVKPALTEADVTESHGADLEFMRNDPATRVRSYAQAGSVIENESLASGFKVYRGEVLWEIDDFAKAEELQVVGMPSGQSPFWTLLRPVAAADSNITLGGRTLHAIRLERSEVIDWLNAMAQPDRSRWTGVIPTPIVVPFGSRQLTGPPAWSLDGEQLPGAVDGRLNWHVAMYLLGNWIETIEIALQHGRVDVTELHVEALNYGSGSVPLTVKVARGDAIPGRYLMRAFGRAAGVEVDLLALDWSANPNYRVFTKADNKGDDGFDLDFVEKAFSAVITFWHEF